MPDDTPDTGTEAPSGAGTAMAALVIEKPEALNPGAQDDDGGDHGETDWKAEAEKWQGLARKHEDRSKANAAAAKELAEIRKSSMSDIEKAVAEATERTRAETMASIGARLVDAEVRVAASGRQVDVDALLDGMDRSRFIDAAGEVDAKAVKAWIEKLAPERTTSATDLGQGARGTARPNDMNSLIRRGAGHSV